MVKAFATSPGPSKLVASAVARFAGLVSSLVLVCAGTVVVPASANAAAAMPAPAACQALKAKYPQFAGKTLVDAVNPHTPGYEALDPKDPSHYIGFDIDLVETIGDCLGFSVTYTGLFNAVYLV